MSKGKGSDEERRQGRGGRARGGAMQRDGRGGPLAGSGQKADPARHQQGAPARPRPDPARHAALALLAAVRSGTSLDAAPLPGALSAADLARARRLAAETLRHRIRADAVLAPLMVRRPKPAIADLLALAVTEILLFDEAPHGAVNAAVDLARAQGRSGAAAAGMVNAVLRRASDARALWDVAPPPRLPEWLRAPVQARWGEAVTRAIEAAHEAGAPLDLTPKPGAGNVPGAALLPTGSLRIRDHVQVSTLPGYSEGEWWVQDAAASLAVKLLAPRPGEHVADLCAAPGGKTLQLAAAGALVTAVDLSPTRLRRVSENLRRCRLDATIVAADALEWRPATPPDAILLDAPCSATGTIRRHPELPLIRDGSAIADLTRLQDDLLDHALSLLPLGGRLVFATCSLLPAEGEERLAAALSRHPGLAVEAPDPAALGIDPDWLTPEGGLRLRPDLWPDIGGMDGFFMVLLRKTADTP